MAEQKTEDPKSPLARRGVRPFAGPAGSAPVRPFLRPAAPAVRPQRPPVASVAGTPARDATLGVPVASVAPVSTTTSPEGPGVTPALVASPPAAAIALPDAASEPKLTPTDDRVVDATIPAAAAPVVAEIPSAADTVFEADAGHWTLAPAPATVAEAVSEAPTSCEPEACEPVDAGMGASEVADVVGTFDDVWSMGATPAPGSLTAIDPAAAAAGDTLGSAGGGAGDSTSTMHDPVDPDAGIPDWLRDEPLAAATPGSDLAEPVLLEAALHSETQNPESDADLAALASDAALADFGLEVAPDTTPAWTPAVVAAPFDAGSLDGSELLGTEVTGGLSETDTVEVVAEERLVAPQAPASVAASPAAPDLEMPAFLQRLPEPAEHPAPVVPLTELSAREAVATTLHRVAERVRQGEIAVSSVAAGATDAAVLASVLAALLGGPGSR